MRAIEWLMTLQDQHDKYGKVVFTPTELSNIASQDAGSINMSLSRLIKRGIIQRYANGKYGLTGRARVEDLVFSMDSAAYVTGMYALYRHQLITQVPTEISCFTNRRHNRSRGRRTVVGRIVFLCVTSAIYSYPEENVIVSPEQAICDFVYLCRRRGVRPSDIVTFRNLHRLDPDLIQMRLKNYPATVKHAIEQFVLSLAYQSLTLG